jgi:hypothetical protein
MSHTGDGWSRRFVYTVIAILSVTVVFKILGACGEEKILSANEPLLSFLSVRQLLVFSAIAEVATICGLCLLKQQTSRFLLILWLSGSFLTYRSGKWLAKISAPCPCLGTVNSWCSIGITPGRLDEIMLALALYMFLGSVLGMLVGLLSTPKAKLTS